MVGERRPFVAYAISPVFFAKHSGGPLFFASDGGILVHVLVKHGGGSDFVASSSKASGLIVVFEKWVRDVQDLKLGDHPELEYIWHGNLHIRETSFSKLKSLVVEGCKICSIIPFHLLPYLSNLEALEVRKCVSVRTIFDVNNDSRPPSSSSSSLQLKKLILEELPNLEHIWNDEPQGILSLQCLQQVCVDRCKSIKSLFPTSVAIDKLEKLELKCCEGLEEIIANNKNKTVGSCNKVFIFHNLSSLTLWELPELNYFYSGLHHLEWPQLNLLNVYHCCKLRTFTAKFPSHLHEAHSTNEQAIVSVEKVVPKLEELLLSENDITMFSHEKFDLPLFNSIRYLKLMCFHGDQTTTFPYRFLLKVRNIEKLLVGCSSFREIFPSMAQLEGSEFLIFRASDFLSRLKELELNDLRELASIGLEHSWHTIPPVLQSLRVVGCSNLIHLVSYTTGSFSSLVDLTLTECHKLEYVFTSSTAITLSLLKNMSISRCDSMKEIVAELVDDSVKHDIMMPQLGTLSLYSLPKLECFYSGSSTFNFVCLREVSINECGIMKIFCQRGDLKTPLLPQDINAGIQEAHDTKTPFSTDHMSFQPHSESQEDTEGQSSHVDSDSTGRDRRPDVHQGPVLRKSNSVSDTKDSFISYLMDIDESDEKRPEELFFGPPSEPRSNSEGTW
ncbi:hypothetical protein K1719_038185 [Acacia pycnantha]|nr:hypothetical protein K1719_038185 [Acacia pycnantha]